MKNYRIVIGCANHIGMGLLENIVAMAKLGAEIDSTVIARMTFPYLVQMTVETETPPTPTPDIRVFDLETMQELPIPSAAPAVITPAVFFLEQTDKPTKEQLDAMEWAELQALAKSAGVTGRDRTKVTKAYLAKFE